VTDDDRTAIGSQGLTAFEFALAGVTPPDGQQAASVRVIDDMRALAAEVVDAPVRLAGLQAFLDADGPWPLRQGEGDRPSQRVGITGAFVDITPPELTGEVPAPPVHPAVAAGAVPDPAGRLVGPEPHDPLTGPSLDEVVTAEIEDAGLASATGASDGATEGDEIDGGIDTAQLRDGTGRFSVAVAAGLAVPPGSSGPDSADDPSPVGAEGVTTGRILATVGDDPTGPVPVAGILLGADPPEAPDGVEPVPATAGLVTLGTTEPPLIAPPAPELATAAGAARGATVPALLGAVAAVTLLLGGLWWAGGSSSGADDTDAAGQAAGQLGRESTEADEAVGSATAGRDPSGSRPASEPSGPTATSATTGRLTSSNPDEPITVTAPRSDEPFVTQTTVRSTTTPTSRTTAPPTTEAQTTAAPTTAAPQTTTTPPTSSETLGGRPAYIGDQVSIGDYDGPGLAGVQVQLWLDGDRDGVADRQVADEVTGSAGRYSFDVPGACYEVRFLPPDGYQIRPDLAVQYLCLDAGEAAARTDAVIVAPVSGPSGCRVDRSGSSSSLGVEVYEEEREWADSYLFLDRSGGVVADTASMGDPDEVDSRTDREWFGGANGFDHRDVRSVSAVRQGVRSEPVRCRRL
jgi:hypothetical protein